MRVAIVSDPLVQRGGAERVVSALAHAFPEAPIYAVLYNSLTGPSQISGRVYSSWLGRVPLAAQKHRLFLPLYRSAVESIDVSAYDVVVSSHHTVAKAILTRADQLHICYCHTPMRALWERPTEELATLPKIIRPLAAALFSHLRVWDAVSANRVQLFLANSGATQRRITKYYRRESEVIFPPIDVDHFSLSDDIREDYYLVVSRPVPYKRVDIAIAATAKLGRRLKIVGGHQMVPGTPSNVEMLGHVTDGQLRDLMGKARALLFPQFEDFGMAPLEANACGTPVIAYAAGGALETVIDGVTGLLCAEQDAECFMEAIKRLETLEFDRTTLRNHALQFSQDSFISRIQNVVRDAWARHSVLEGRLTVEL